MKVSKYAKIVVFQFCTVRYAVEKWRCSTLFLFKTLLYKKETDSFLHNTTPWFYVSRSQSKNIIKILCVLKIWGRVCISAANADAHTLTPIFKNFISTDSYPSRSGMLAFLERRILKFQVS